MTADLALGDEFAGFRIVDTIGRGGMGVVYRAEHLTLGRQVALKVLAPELAADSSFRNRFLREARLAASLDHPNILPVFDAGQENGILYLAMPLVEGSDLRRLINEEGSLEVEPTLSILG